MGIKTELLSKANDIVASSTDAKELALASAIVKNVAEAEGVVDEEIYTIGTAGSVGFGVGAVRDWQMPAGFIKLAGHDNPVSENYGNVTDMNGSVMVAIPKFYFKIETNNVLISSKLKAGYVVHRAFINEGKEHDYIFVDKYGCGNVGGVFTSKAGLDPCSTHADHNPIASLKNTPSNTYGGLYSAVKTRGDKHFLTSKFIYSALAMLAFAHGKAATTTSACAFIDVDPKMPKGNLNSALSDVNDTSVVFSPSGYSNCALTGSGSPFAKTTHNGQECGIADLNGNMWEVASGFIRTDANGFLILKESVDITNISSDDTTQAVGGAYDIDLYDVIDISDVVNANDGWTYLGNGANQVFAMSTDRTSADYKRTALGIPLATGHSATGTIEFGNDGVYRYLRDEMACRCGGSWGYSSGAGAFAMYLGSYRTHSNDSVGGRASVLV
ncbi:hypothetical protein [Halarcobacter anaerophilus]|uniref:Uncharacterized protein n=1 Tax=Halarcobacter anaerophilus TaxID=877500 RepID=A0A4Q0Y1U3_9BACT|nr:hypothetical protein [Halarcobacter anaerophilus]QDF28998.1 hypothetical protein AANAER_1518 [Halarcobacter anaerophilus]RXJ63633.1 hypothetical protein CRV06_05415 [Halarcobacter anaerophilus]